MRRVPRFLRLPLRSRSRIASDVDAELAYHLELCEDELVRDGVPRARARALAAERFGDIEYTRRYCREVDMSEQRARRFGDVLEEMWQDVRYAVRQLARAPGFTVVALLTLALGIGANAAIFSVVNGVVLKPLPFEEADRVLRVHSFAKGGRGAVSIPDYLDWRHDATSFEAIAAYYESTTNLTGTGDPERLSAARVTADYFRALRVPATLGRVFATGDDEPSSTRGVVLGYALWQRRFGGDPRIVNTTITLDGQSYAIIGVTPAAMRYPAGTDLYLPFVVKTTDGAQSRGARWLGVVARLSRGATLARAKTEMATIAARLAREDPKHNQGYGTLVEPMRETMIGDVRTPLFVLLAAVSFVMLIACANVANLLLVRTAARETEIAVRLSLGAGRGRLARQLLTESLVLSLFGGALGCLVAVALTKAFVALAPSSIPRIDEVKVDATMLAFAFGVAIVTGLAFGLIPAMQGASPRLAQRLREGGRGARSTRARQRSRGLLTISELALAVMLLAGAGLLVRSFSRLASVDPGFRPTSLLTFRVTLPESGYKDSERQRAFMDQLLERMRALPGVRSATASMGLPLSDVHFSLSFTIDEGPAVAPQDEPSAQVRIDSPDYFQTLGIPIVKGRAFDANDRPGQPLKAVVNETFARRFFPNGDVLGKHVRQGWTRDSVKLGGEIVGVTRDTKQFSLGEDVRPEVHYSATQWPIDEFSVVLRTDAPPATTFSAVRDAIKQLDVNLPMFDARDMQSLVDESVAGPKFYMLLLTIFAAVALSLAAVGIYGVISYAVAQRSHEIGVRMALGATSSDVSRMVVRQGATLTVAGLLIGLAGAFALTRLLSTLLFGVSARDPLTFGLVPLVLAGVSLLASWLPARRAARVDPMGAIRSE